MKYTVYKTTNLINGKIYIGRHQTKNIDDFYLGSGKVFKRALMKYGKENFSKEVLAVFDTIDESKSYEALIVDEIFLSRSDTYNMAPGGGGHGGSQSAEARDRVRENNRKLKAGNQYRLGGKLSEESKKRIGDANRGRIKSEKERNDISLRMKCDNPAKTQSSRRKISESKTGNQNVAGKVWITDGVKFLRVFESDIPSGWRRGAPGRNRKIKS